jgi:hypothetical protein
MNSKQLISPLLWFAVLVFVIGLVASLGPIEQSLGVNIRVVYLHVAWVWAALTAYLAAAAVGVVGLVSRREALHRWSRALGRTGLFFWITYLPLSLWAMQANWNGLFLAEPRWRLGVIFAIGGLILQVGLTLLENPFWASLGNTLYFLLLLLALRTTQQIMHPPSPILSSESGRIQLFFALLFVLTVLAAWQVARFFHIFEIRSVRE